MWKTLVAIAGLALLAGCSVKTDLPRATASIAAFHQRLNAGDFAGIYDNAGAEMKAATSEAALTQFLSAVHRKLGTFQSGSMVGWNDNINTSGHFVTIGYSANYAGGPATESFLYRMDKENTVLVGYHINSMALIVK